LAAAQELMKIMAGAVRFPMALCSFVLNGFAESSLRHDRDIFKNPDKQPDYAAQTQKELDRVQQRALLLNEMLNAAGPNERFADGDTYDVSFVLDAGREC
jgi:hypothetical protein